MRKSELELKQKERVQSEHEIVKGVQRVQVRIQCVQETLIQSGADRAKAWETVNGGVQGEQGDQADAGGVQEKSPEDSQE